MIHGLISVVRVQAGRLRTKLQEYYSTGLKRRDYICYSDLPRVIITQSSLAPIRKKYNRIFLLRSSSGNGKNGVFDNTNNAAIGNVQVESTPQPRSKTGVILLWHGLVTLLAVAVTRTVHFERELRRQAAVSPSP